MHSERRRNNNSRERIRRQSLRRRRSDFDKRVAVIPLNSLTKRLPARTLSQVERVGRIYRMTSLKHGYKISFWRGEGKDKMMLSAKQQNSPAMIREIIGDIMQATELSEVFSEGQRFPKTVLFPLDNNPLAKKEALDTIRALLVEQNAGRMDGRVDVLEGVEIHRDGAGKTAIEFRIKSIDSPKLIQGEIDLALAWRNATPSKIAANRGKKEATIIEIDRLLAEYTENLASEAFANPSLRLQKLEEIKFTINRWLATYSGTRAEAAGELREVLNQEIIGLKAEGVKVPPPDRYPRIDFPPTPDPPVNLNLYKAEGDTYFSMGMKRDGGLVKDLNSPSLEHNRLEAERGELKPNLVYMDETLRRRYEVTIQPDGLLYVKNFQKDQAGRILGEDQFDLVPLDTRGESDGVFIFVMDGNGRIFTASKLDVEHHSSFLAGNPAASAGMIGVEGGRIVYVNGESGHYQPTREFNDQFKIELRSKNVDLADLEEGKMQTLPQRRASGLPWGPRLYPSGPQQNSF